MPASRRDDIQISALPAPAARIGESPVWLPESREILWVDMPAGRIYVTSLLTGRSRTIQTPTYLGAVSPDGSGGYRVACREGFAVMNSQGDFEVTWPILSDGHRMNDAKVDPVGRWWAGSLDVGFAPGEGRLWCAVGAGEPRLMLEGLTQPNGMTWSPDGLTFYLIDSAERELCAFDVDAESGAITARRLVRAFPESEGYADGMTVDAEGCLVVAMWGGGALARIAPDGVLLDRVPLPVVHPTSCAFVGEQLDQLVVTSADEPGEVPPGSLAGGSLLVISGIPGRGVQTSLAG